MNGERKKKLKNEAKMVNPYYAFACIISWRFTIDIILGWKIDEFTNKDWNILPDSPVLFFQSQEKPSALEVKNRAKIKSKYATIDDTQKLAKYIRRLCRINGDSEQDIKYEDDDILQQYLDINALKQMNNVQYNDELKVSFKNLMNLINGNTYKYLFQELYFMIIQKIQSLFCFRMYRKNARNGEFKHSLNYQFLESEKELQSGFTKQYKDQRIMYFRKTLYFFSKYELIKLGNIKKSPSFGCHFISIPTIKCMQEMQHQQKRNILILRNFPLIF